MKLTRLQLNQMLCQLPDPKFAEMGQCSPIILIPISDSNCQVIKSPSELPGISSTISALKFEYSKAQRDWVLNLDIK